MRRTCFYNEFARQFPKGSGSAPRSLELYERSRSHLRLFFGITLQSRRNSFFLTPFAVAKPTLKASELYSKVRSVLTGEPEKVMAQAEPSKHADAEGLNRFRQLFAGAMPKEEVGALSFLKVVL